MKFSEQWDQKRLCAYYCVVHCDVYYYVYLLPVSQSAGLSNGSPAPHGSVITSEEATGNSSVDV